MIRGDLLNNLCQIIGFDKVETNEHTVTYEVETINMVMKEPFKPETIAIT